MAASDDPTQMTRVDLYERKRKNQAVVVANIGKSHVGIMKYGLADRHSPGLLGMMSDAAGGPVLYIEDLQVKSGAMGPFRGIGSGMVAHAIASKQCFAGVSQRDIPVVVPLPVAPAKPFYAGLGFASRGSSSMVLPEMAALAWDAFLGDGRCPVDFKQWYQTAL